MQMQNVGHIQTKLTPKRSRVCVLQEILEIAIDIKQIVKNSTGSHVDIFGAKIKLL